MRILKRWTAECDFEVIDAQKKAVGCPFNSRKDPRVHLNATAATREAAAHAIEAGHVGAREVQVKRTYAPRVLEKEEVVS